MPMEPLPGATVDSGTRLVESWNGAFVDFCVGASVVVDAEEVVVEIDVVVVDSVVVYGAVVDDVVGVVVVVDSIVVVEVFGVSCTISVSPNHFVLHTFPWHTLQSSQLLASAASGGHKPRFARFKSDLSSLTQPRWP